MIHSLAGTFAGRRDNHIVLEVHGVGFKVFASASILQNLPSVGAPMQISCFLYVREDALDLYGFSNGVELELFEKLRTVSGIGPKTAMGVIGAGPIDRLVTAINEGQTEILTKVSGIGRKTAERMVLELKGKLTISTSPETISLMESDLELEETLVGLGYTKAEARGAVLKIDKNVKGFKERLRLALKNSKK